MTIRANTFGSDYSTDLVVYTGARGNLVEVACNDDAGGASVSIEVVAGQTYYFMVGAFGSGPGGTLVFNLAPEPRETSAPQFRFSGKGASAFFLSESECVRTSVEFRTSEQWTKPGSFAPTRESVDQASIERHDSCTDTELSMIFAFTTEGVALQVDNDLAVVSLQATVPGIDVVSGAEVLLDVNLEWTAIGDPVTTAAKSREVFFGGLLITNFKGTRRDATASGTVLLDGVNLTPNPTDVASIFDAKQLTLTVEKATP